MPTPFSSNNENVQNTQQLIVQNGYKIKVLNESQDRIKFGQNTLINEPDIFQSVDLAVNNQVKMEIKDSGVKVTGDLTTEGNIRLPDSFAIYQGTNPINQDPFLYGNSNNTTLNSKNQSFLQIDNDTIVKVLPTGAEITGDLATTGDCEFCTDNSVFPDYDTTPPNTYGAGFRIQRTTNGTLLRSKDSDISLGYTLFVRDDGQNTKLNSRNGLTLCRADSPKLEVLTGGVKVHGDLETTGYASFGNWLNATYIKAFFIRSHAQPGKNSLVLSNTSTVINHTGITTGSVFLNIDGQTTLRCNGPAHASGQGVEITGNLTVSGTAHAGGQLLTSDDRLKFNETPITNALDTIRLLVPQTYDKSTYIPEDGIQPENTFKEAGLIAQEVLEIPELAQFVKPDGVEQIEVQATDEENEVIEEADNALRAQKVVEAQVPEEDEIKREVERAITTQLEVRLADAKDAAVHPNTTRIKPFSLDYNSIFTHLIAAVKELDQIVQSQQKRIDILENK